MLDRRAAGPSLIFCVSTFVALSLQTLHSPEMAGQAPLRPEPDAFPVEVCRPDLQPPLHALGRESLMGLVNKGDQS